MVRALACHARGRGFEPRHSRHHSAIRHVVSPESYGSGPYILSMYYVYILQSLVDSSFYIGSTSNLKRRFIEHNQGKSRYTSHLKPLKLIFYEAYLLKSDAQRREMYLKTTRGRTSLKTMLKNYFLVIR